MSFASDVRAFAEKAKVKTETVIRAATLEISTNIILKTPVDTGRARNNWIASIDSRAHYTRKTGDPSGAKAIGGVQTVISKFGGNVYYLTNNLPYIRRLEYEGWSSQAPAGMLRVSVLEYEQALKRKVAELS